MRAVLRTTARQKRGQRLSAHPRFLVLLILLLALTACVPSSNLMGSTRPVVKVGLIAPFEELYRADGYAALYAVKLAIGERNAAGGVAGQPVALVALNDNGRPEEAAVQAAGLGIDPAVLGVIGPVRQATAAAAGPALAAQDLAWLTPQPLLACPEGWSLAAPPLAFARQALDELAVSGVTGQVFLFSEDPVTLAADLPAPAGIEIVPRPLQIDAAPTGAAGLIWLGDAAGGARLLLASGSQSPFVGGPEVGSSVFAGRAGEAATQARWLSSGPAPESLPADFLAAYRELAGSDPGPQAVLAYDATRLLLDAMAAAGQAGPLTRERVAQAVESLGLAGWEGLAGRIVWAGEMDEAACRSWQNAPLNLFSHTEVE